ncbi:hypothetical protein [Azospirillum picis]|uniref:Cobalamin biosynthesis Mg chelatase CobN n=1 Tax=Azospirillum picis TaxID=488438 RepID=A0ABU0MJE4_9PROT|nr:hypothetical protein [Azospirillum picis]MBP2299789.1 cobalamin biosynthesis Mg chelatase CobN [Azospirillum picis]MDQ0533585.1 cobalamin biosynthesis Mg chelatase CobN [Azospirillum picis]
MTGFETALRLLADDLLAAVGRGDWDAADAELATLAEEAAAAMAAGRTADLSAVARQTVRCHTALSLGEDGNGNAMQRLGQLRMLALVVAAARSRKPPRTPRLLAAPGTPGAAILSALKRGPLSGPALAGATGLSAAAIAAALPELRACGLVRSWPAGRLTFNASTDRPLTDRPSTGGENATAREMP